MGKFKSFAILAAGLAACSPPIQNVTTGTYYGKKYKLVDNYVPSSMAGLSRSDYELYINGKTYYCLESKDECFKKARGDLQKSTPDITTGTASSITTESDTEDRGD